MCELQQRPHTARAACILRQLGRDTAETSGGGGSQRISHAAASVLRFLTPLFYFGLVPEESMPSYPRTQFRLSRDEELTITLHHEI